MDAGDNKDVKLSAEVEPFIPQKKGLEGALVGMSLPGETGGSGGSGVETAPIPSYLITCYPFVQENQPNRQHPMYNGGELRWQQPNPSPGGPYLAYPILSSPQPPVSNDYTYYQIMPAPCTPMMGFYQPFPGPYPGPVQAGVVNPVSTDVSDRALPLPGYGLTNQRGRGLVRPAVLPKQQLGPCPQRGRRPPTRSVAVQKEVCTVGPDGRTKTVMLVDAAQQTDFPGDLSGRCSADRVSPLSWKNRTKRRRQPQNGESYSEPGTSEADIDSDSGYCSPKHNQQGTTQRTLETTTGTTGQGVEAGVMTGGTWGPGLASQGTQKSWGDRNGPFLRVDQKKPEQRNFSQDYHSGFQQRTQPLQTEQRLQSAVAAGSELTPEPLYFQDEDEFPDLASAGAPLSSKPDPPSVQAQTPPKVLPKALLDNLPENSPISIVQTPIPITTSVPKRAKSQRKKALAAALATAQEYSEISMEQKKLQEAVTKATGKRSKTQVQLDMDDILTALAKHQQAMKARQITNTKPLSFTVGTTLPYHGMSLNFGSAMLKTQQNCTPHNPLDSTAPKVKRGKEREIPKVKRPTALKKIILKEREGKKGKKPSEPESLSLEEHSDECLNFTDDLTQEPASQEESGLSVPSDTSLSPASQNSPYSITPVSQGSPASSGIGSPMASNAITKIHSRRFREYCNQVLSKEIDESVTLLLQELVHFQERVYQKDPTKAKSKRRVVMGLREVTKHMKLQKIKCVIISPNCEKIQAKGGLDEALYNVIAMAREQEIPFVFALGRKALGRCVNKLVAVSVVGIFNYSGAEALFNQLVALTEEARKAYKDMVSALEQEKAEEALKQERGEKRGPHFMGHSRNPSAASAISFCSTFSEPISEVNEKDYETNWRNMVEPSDNLEPAEPEPPRPSPLTSAQKEPQETQTPTNNPPALPLSTASHSAPTPTDKEEVRVDDRLELASQQSTETGSLDGSCRGPLNSSITSTTSTLVPGMLEEAEEEDEEEEDYTPEPISVEVPTISSRIEIWLQENLQLGKSQDSTEEEDKEEEEEEEQGHSDEEDLDSAEVSEKDAPEQEVKKVTG